MKITATTKFGGQSKSEKNLTERSGFVLVLAAEVTEEQRDELAMLGLASLAYRAGASVINKALGVKKNTEAEWSEENASKVVVALGEWAESKEVEGITGAFELDVVATERVFGETSGPKFATEKNLLALKVKDGGTVEGIAAKVGFKGETGTAAEPTEEFCLALKQFLAAALKAATEKLG